jgi:2-methylcitrate dehydratase PrpD
MDTLSKYMSAAGTRALPPEAVEQTKYHLLDTFASMISGSELPSGKAAQRFIRAYKAKGTATIVGTNLTAAPAEAALANGLMAHADETDDSHGASRSHPGCAVVPAALATAEELGCDGNRFLRAVAAGYDIGPRVTMAMGGVKFYNQTKQSTHSIAGAFGAAAAASCIAGLDPQQMRWVIDYTSQQSAGITAWRRDKDHIEKAFVFAGNPARSGVMSALLVRAGWTGVDDVFSGSDNFFLAYAPTGNPDLLIEDLGERYEVIRTDIKKWSVGSPIQAPLDAVDAIQKKQPFGADQVQKVTVRLAPAVAQIVDNRDLPDICLQHMIAVMLLDKTVSFQAAHDKQRMQDARILRERQKVNLVKDEELARFLPVRVAIVEVEFNDGKRLTERVDAVRGTQHNPMSRAEVIEKARGLTAPVLGDKRSARLIEVVLNIEAQKDIRNLRPLIVRKT